MKRYRWIVVFLGLCIGGITVAQTADANPRSAASKGLLVPPPGYFYHGVYPGAASEIEDDTRPSDLDAYETAVGKKAAWVYISNNWYFSRAFPEKTAEWIRAKGSIPFIRMMLRSDNETDRPEPTYTLEAIRRGDFDSDLKAWASSAKDFGSPILVEWGTEMNGQWFTWNAKWNGGGGVGSELFKQTYRHIVNVIQNQGATNILWVWHIAATDDPEADWNRFENYYPGGDVVDWIGISVYGGQSPLDEEWPSFGKQLDRAIPRLNKLAPTKPVIVAEFGASAGNPKGSPEHWADDALRQLTSNRWPSIRGFSWWNESWQNDDFSNHDTEMRVQKLPELAAVFKKYLSLPRILDRPILP